MNMAVLLGVAIVLFISGCTAYNPVPIGPGGKDAAVVEPSRPPAGDGPRICIQVITPARNQLTGDCRDFPTPCDVPDGWEPVGSCPLPEPAKEKNVTLTIVMGETRNVTLNGVEHTVKFLGAESVIEAAMQVDRFGNVYLKGRMLNVTGNKGKVGVYVDDITIKPAITKQTSVTVTLVDLKETFGGTPPAPVMATGY